MGEKNTKYIFTFEEKKELINKHFVYEVERMLQSGNKLMVGMEDKILCDLVLESFLLHVRNLREFFCDGEYKDTALVEHYISDWEDLDSQKLAFIDKERLNKEISHLTYSRNKVSFLTKSWPIDEIYFRLIKIIKLFLSKLDRNYFDIGLLRLEKELNSDDNV